MQWFLMIYMAGFTQFQAMGPWPEEGQCKVAKVAVEHSFKKATAGCIPYPVQPQPQPQQH
jgi:hypothetical protein